MLVFFNHKHLKMNAQIRNSIFFLALLFIVALFLFSACQKNPVEVVALSQHDILCEGSSEGEINLDIENTNWKSSCVIPSYYENSSPHYKVLTLYTYNNGLLYFGNSDFEYFALAYSEVEEDGQIIKSISASFVDGAFDYVKADNDPEYEFAGKVYATYEEDLTINQFNFTKISSNKVEGNFSLTLYEEESKEGLKVSGSFSTKIE